MRVKVFKDQNVYEALQDRLSFIFSEFDSIYIAFSGGKDSGALLNLVLKYKYEHEIKKKLGLFHQDFEAQYEKTTEFVTRTFENITDDVEPYWVCLPMASKTPMSNYETYWYPWDDEKKDVWVRPMPDYPNVINMYNNPFGFYKYKMRQEDLYKRFNEWYGNTHGGKTVCLIGMRADESLNRYSAIINKKNDYKGKKWITKNFKDVWTASPLYDWTAQDIWTANGKFGFDYNKLYDLFYKAGLPMHQMRVGSPFNEWAVNALNLYRIIEPKTWAKLVKRVQGANFGAIYGKTKAMGYKGMSLPPGHTWESYAKFLLATLPKNAQANYKKRSVSPDGVVNWKNICLCILKNDHRCRFASPSREKYKEGKLSSVKEKYKSL